MTAPTPERLAAIRARQARMPNGHAGSSQGELLDAVADRNTLLAWVDSLLRWQPEATEALTAWDKVWFAAGEPGPLGGSKANATAAEVDRLRARLAVAWDQGYSAHANFRLAPRWPVPNPYRAALASGDQVQP